jgi:murein DD-endopeptidase MepM/ murein hydrolase activator NlpD
MAAKRKISFLVVPEGGRVFSLKLPVSFFRLLVGVLGLAVVALIVGSFFYGELLYNSSRLRKIQAENRRLLEYNAKVLEIERELDKNRELTARIVSAAGIPTEKEVGTQRGGETLLGEAVASQLEPHPFWEKLFPAYVGGMIPTQGAGRIPRGLPLLGYITRGFVEEPDLFKSAHTGIDIAVTEGTAVLATASGAVEFAGWDDTYGYLVIIDHHNGYETIYGHNSNLRVYSGDFVNQADIIALSGNTGRSTGPHLHYEIRKDGKPVDPKEFF